MTVRARASEAVEKAVSLPPLSQAQWPLLHACWRLGRASARQILEEYVKTRPADYHTIRTQLTRMAEKGYLAVDKRRREHYYTPKVGREQVLASAITSMMSDVVGPDGESVAVARQTFAALAAQAGDAAEVFLAKERRSIGELDVFERGAKLLAAVRQHEGPEQSLAKRAADLVEEGLLHLAEAVHGLNTREKEAALHEAQRTLARAAGTLLLGGARPPKAPVSSWVETLESELIPGVSALRGWSGGAG